MKICKTLSVLLLIVVMILSSSVCMIACAEEPAVTTGSITITNVMPDTTYTLYKVFDATYTTIEGEIYMAYTLDTVNGTTENNTKANNLYTAISKGASDNTCPFTAENTSTSGVYQIKRKSDAAVTDSVVTTWVNGQLSNLKVVETFTATNATSGTHVFSNLTPGYYLVNSTLETVSTATITNLAPNASIIDKTPRAPGVPEKSAKKSAEIGEEVTFTVAFKAVNFSTENLVSYRILNYVLDDTATYLDPIVGTDHDQFSSSVFGDPSGTVTLYSARGTDESFAEEDKLSATYPAPSYSTTYDSTTSKRTLTITWGTAGTDKTDGSSLYPENTWVVIKYRMKMTDGVYDNSTTSATAFKDAVNTVDGSIQLSTVTDLKSFGSDTVKVKTTGISITKVDSASTTTKLEGAKFKLYKKVKTETETEKKMYWRNSSTDMWVEDVTAATEVTADNNDSTAEFFGLGAGEYFLTETYAPNGYYLPTSDFKVVITETTAASTTETTLAVTVTPEDGITPASNAELSSNQIFVTTIGNTRGMLLPTTGGIGTTIFYVAGGVIFVAAIVLLITKKRMNDR